MLVGLGKWLVGRGMGWFSFIGFVVVGIFVWFYWLFGMRKVEIKRK